MLIAERSSRESLEGVIGRQLAREAGHTAHQLSAVLQTVRETLRSFARQDLMREIRVADIDKRVSMALTTLREGSPVRTDYLVVDPERSVVAASDPSLIGTTPPWVDAGWASAGPGESLVGPLRTEATPVLLMTTPIPDPDDPRRTLATLVGVFDWTQLTRVTGAVRRDLAAQGVAAQVLVSRADGSVIGGAQSTGDAGNIARPPDLSEAAQGMNGASPDYIVDARSGLIIGRASLDPDLPEWKLMVVEPRADALAPARRSSQRLAVGMGLALVTALGLATLAARRVVRPLSELTGAIRELSKGGANARPVPVRTDDEVGVLAASFNQMASELERTQRNLVEAEKFAFVGELAAGVAHEIRTALNVLGSSTQILERSLPADGDPEAAELAEMIRAEVGRLANVVNDLLTLSRPHPLSLESGLLSEPLFRAADFVAPQARDKEIRIVRTVPDDEVSLPRDSELIHQAAVNLLVNAIQALGHGGCIEIRVLATKDGHGGFEVSDDGPGIPGELRDRIFDPFVTARDGGVGLGLTFVKRVAHDHHGSISVESEPGSGTCFRIRLPMRDASR